MANIRDIRSRIKSVKNTQQITKAMKMVSTAKLKKAQENATGARPYAEKMTQVLTDLAARIGDDFKHPLLDARGDQKYLIVLITADKGLAGDFNSKLIRTTQTFIVDNSSKDMEMMAVGRKGRDFFKRRDTNISEEYLGLTGKGRVEFSEVAPIAREIIKRFTEDESIDKVFLVFSEFKSALQRDIRVDQLLPLAKPESESENSTTENKIEYLYEQSPAEIFSGLLPKLVETRLFRATLESVASEQGARMAAMDAASKNAGDLIRKLTLDMNRIRQAAITKEIIEIVSGAAAAAG